MKKINWSIRRQNVVYIIQVIGSALLPVLAYMGLTPESFSSWPALGQALLDAVSSPYLIGLFLWGIWCATTDPTTPGVRDSGRALRRHKLGSD